MLYENGSYSNSVMVDYSTSSGNHLFTKDYNGDGITDLEYTGQAAGSKFFWAQNDGAASFSPAQQLMDESQECHTSGLEDFDGDGDLDLIVAGSGQTILYRNQNNNFTGENITSVSYGQLPGKMTTFDLENDGDMDAVIAASEDLGGLNVLINDGSGHFNTVFLDDVTSWYNTWIEAYDFDQDGDNDLAFNFWIPQENPLVGIYEYDGGSFTRHIIEEQNFSSGYSPYILHVMDVDNDGLKDIVYFTTWSGPAIDDGGIYWYKNLGNLQFSSPYYCEVAETITQPYDLKSLDRDLDGDDDFILTDQGNAAPGIFYFENLFWGSYRLQGNVFYDADNSASLNSGDAPFPFVDIQVNPTESAFFTNADGEYNLLTGSGTYTITPGIDQNLWSFSTLSSSYTETLSASNPIQTGLDFGVVPVGSQPGVLLQAVEPTGPCNVESSMWITLQNTGNTILSGQLVVTLDSLLTFVSSQPQPDSTAGNILYYSLDSLYFYHLNTWQLNVDMPSEQWMGVPLTNHAWYTDNSGLTVSDTSDQELTCAYDPNDKTEKTGIGEEGLIADGQWLEYTIRFQNTGNDTATNITIRDPLSAYLDRSTLTPIAWSFSPEISVEPDGDAVFKFKDIMLPDSGANFAGSQGFIRYRIKADAGLFPGTVINNTAHIIFDFNPPVITNTTINTVECYMPSGMDISWTYPKLNSPFIHPESQQWYLDDAPVAGATGPSLIPAANGEYRVEAIYPVNCKLSSSAFAFNSLNSQETDILQAVIYPNPFKNSTTIEFNRVLTESHSLIITDLAGREMVRKSMMNGNRLLVSGTETGRGFFLTYIESDGKRSFLGKIIAE